MGGPFFWRHLWIVVGVALNFLLAVLAVGKARRSFGRLRLPAALALRALSFLWLVLSLVGLLLAVSLFHALEIEGEPNWRANRGWPRIQPGTSKREVVALLGPPETHIGVRYGYHLAPLYDQEATVTFEGDPNAANLEDTLDAGAKVVGKTPEAGRSEWMSPYFLRLHVGDHVRGGIPPLATAGVLTLLVLSLIPFSLRAGWSSWTLSIPVMTLVFGALYEASIGAGWRFDLFLFVPAYLVIAAAWLVRVGLLIRRGAPPPRP